VARRPTPRLPGAARRASPWWLLVAGSGLVLLVVAAVMGAWWVASGETRITTYRVLGSLNAIELDLGEADVDIAGGARVVEVRRTDEYAFGQAPRERRAVSGGVLRIGSSCAETVVGSCRSAYRIAVPDNVQVTLRTTSGQVGVDGLNGSARIATGAGPIAVRAFCGFSLSASSSSGDVRAATDCSPDSVELRSGSGDVRADVPAGRYSVEAASGSGAVRVAGVVAADDASFRIQVVSASGDVAVVGGR